MQRNALVKHATFETNVGVSQPQPLSQSPSQWQQQQQPQRKESSSSTVRGFETQTSVQAGRSSRLVMRKFSTLKKKTPPAEERVQVKLSILTIAKIKRMAARVKKQYLARHPHLLQIGYPGVQNTYQVPSEEGRVNVQIAAPILEYATSFFFSDVKNYMPALINRLVQSASDDILRKSRDRLKGSRYKLISQVTVVQRLENEGAIEVATNCLWDGKMDDYATYRTTVKNMHVIATVYAVYFE